MLKPGDVVDRYRIEALVGEGGAGSVYRVRHVKLDTTYALKVSHNVKESLRIRFARESRLQAKLRHPNIVAVHDVLETPEVTGLVMDYVAGPSLKDWLLRTKPSLDEVLEVFRGLVEGVAYAHAQGMIHRDIKPSNVLLDTRHGPVVPKITDFGIAKALDQHDDHATRTGATLGTPAFMAPEQIRDASSVDQRADLYSLGCVLYTLVARRAPFSGTDLIDLFRKVADGDYPDPRTYAPDLPEYVVQVIDDLLVTNPALRLADCDALLDRLYEPPPSDGRPVPRRRGPTTLPGTEPMRPSRTVSRTDTARDEPSLVGFAPGERVLIVADSLDRRLQLRMQLDRARLDVTEAGDLTTAERLARRSAGAGQPFTALVVWLDARDDDLIDRVARHDHLAPARLVLVDRALPDRAAVDQALRDLRGLPPDDEPNTLFRAIDRPTLARDVFSVAGLRHLVGVGCRVLIAEDNVVNRRVAERTLARLSFEVDTVPDGAAAVQAAADKRYDVILMDCVMPGLDGFEATRRIRAAERADRHVPIIALTANNTPEDRRRALGAGMDDFLTKPLDKQRLTHTLQKWVRPFSPYEPHFDIADLVDEAELHALADLLGDEDEGLRDVIGLFVDQAPADRDRLLALADAGDRDGLADHLRHLLATASQFGAHRLADQCRAQHETAPTASATELERETKATAKLLLQTADALSTIAERIERDSLHDAPPPPLTRAGSST